MFPWCGQDDRNESHWLDQVLLLRNVKTDGFGQQRTFSHPVLSVHPVFGSRLHFRQTLGVIQGRLVAVRHEAVPSCYLSGKIRKDPLAACR